MRAGCNVFFPVLAIAVYCLEQWRHYDFKQGEQLISFIHMFVGEKNLKLSFLVCSTIDSLIV